MNAKQHLSIAYDKEADVLYLNLQDTEGAAEEIDEGVFARYSPDDRSLVGFTVVNFSKKFDATHRDVEIPLHA